MSGLVEYGRSKPCIKLSSNKPGNLLFSHDVVNIKLSDKPLWYFEKNPLGKVPAIETESGDSIYESLIISDYLDEKYSQRQLHPKDPTQKAKDRILVEHFTKVGIVYIIITIIITTVVVVVVIITTTTVFDNGNTLIKITCSSSVKRTPINL
jgi:hypothetical protein